MHPDVPEPGGAEPGLHHHFVDTPDRYAEQADGPGCAPASQMLILALEMVGIAYLLYALGRALGRAIWSWSKPTPTHRVTGALLAVGVASLVALLWTS